MSYKDQIEQLRHSIADHVDPEFLELTVELLTEITSKCELPTGMIHISDYSEQFNLHLVEKDSRAFEVLISFEMTQLCVEAFIALHLANPGINFSSRTQRTNEFHQSTVSALSFIQINLNAIKMCALHLSDLPARIICRSVTEAADLLIAIQAEDQLGANWIDSQDDPRAFWHENLSGNRLSKKRNRLLKQLFEDRERDLNTISNHLKNESEMFSMASHPSYQAGIMVFLEFVDESDWHAKRTIRHSCFRVAIALQASLVACVKRPIGLEKETTADTDRIRQSITALIRASIFSSMCGGPESDYKKIREQIETIS